MYVYIYIYIYIYIYMYGLPICADRYITHMTFRRTEYMQYVYTHIYIYI